MKKDLQNHILKTCLCDYSAVDTIRNFDTNLTFQSASSDRTTTSSRTGDAISSRMRAGRVSVVQIFSHQPSIEQLCFLYSQNVVAGFSELHICHLLSLPRLRDLLNRYAWVPP